MTLHEKLALDMQALELRKQGKIEEAEKMEREMIPMSPYMAKWAKKHLGANWLINGGWNLSEAEAEFGPGWLTQ